jgi:hypothetical protein
MKKTDETSQSDTTPIKHKVDVQNSNDNKIDEDFKGFPNDPSKESVINPKTPTERKTAQVDKKPVKNTSGPSH